MRRVPSNRMPSFQEPSRGLVGKLLLILVIVLLIMLFWIQPWFLCIPAGYSVVFAAQSLLDNRRVSRFAECRKGESLCSFVRALDYRRIDTWVIRAVYEQVQPMVGFPIRVSDHIANDLQIDADDLDDITDEIAVRTGRPLKNTKENPWYGRVNTVKDLVLFFDSQPKHC